MGKEVVRMENKLAKNVQIQVQKNTRNSQLGKDDDYDEKAEER